MNMAFSTHIAWESCTRRGLSIVELLAARWGVEREALGKWVWAEFPVALPA